MLRYLCPSELDCKGATLKISPAVGSTYARKGEPSSAERMLALRDDLALGPFRLAYLETLVLAADMRVSVRAAEDKT